MASTVPAPHDQPNVHSIPGPVTSLPVPNPGVPNLPVPNPRVTNPQGLDPVLLDVLACPADHHAPLRLGSPDDPGAANLTCTECGRVFPIRDGIPVLLLDEATSSHGGSSLDSAGR